jgi:hypothetical protein
MLVDGGMPLDRNKLTRLICYIADMKNNANTRNPETGSASIPVKGGNGRAAVSNRSGLRRCRQTRHTRTEPAPLTTEGFDGITVCGF